MNWKEYEDAVYEELQKHYPTFPITRNVTINGLTSKISRQIDILIEAQILDSPVRIIVDAKMRKSPIDVNDVESFIGMMADVGAHRGILISTAGYTKTAIQRAHHEVNQDVELDIYSLDELKHLQGELGIPYSGNYGVILHAPFGWVIDAQKRDGFVASLYQREFDFETSLHKYELMYLNFWIKESPEHNLDYLVQKQAENLEDAKLIYLNGVDRKEKTLIRLAEVPSYPGSEYTGFIEFENFILFVVLLTNIEMSKRNLRKLREVLRTAVQIKINHK